MDSNRLKAALLAALLAGGAALGIALPGGEGESPASSSQPSPPTAPVAQPAFDGVPADHRAEIARVLAAFEAGIESPYPEDGGTFENREGRLPDQPLGYYREYTVPTPSSLDRGARRLVIGEGGETYYTLDHYGSLILIDPEDYL